MRHAVATLLALLCLTATAASAQGVAVPPFERAVLPNGLTLITMPRSDVPLVGFAAIVRGGAAADPEGGAGVASLTAGLLEKGAGARSAFEFADTVEGAGGSFSASAGAEAIFVSGTFLARSSDLMIGLLADALLRPRFEQDEFVRLRDRQIELIRAEKDRDPSQLLRVYGRALLFAGHPYGSPEAGSERSLAALGRDDVLAYYAANFGADRVTLVVTGDIETQRIRAAVERAFAGWGPAAGPTPPLPEPARASGRRVLLVDLPGAAQTYFWLANVGVPRAHPGRAALDVVNTVYGGRFTSILNTELRVKSGLSYGAASGFTRGTVAGEFAIRSFSATENTGAAIDLALETLAALKRDGIPDELLASGRSYILGQYPLQLETSQHWAAALAELELYRLGPEHIESYGPAVAAVGPADARRVIDAVLPAPEDLVLVLIGDAAQIREVARRYGPVTEMPLADPDFRPLPRG